MSKIIKKIVSLLLAFTIVIIPLSYDYEEKAYAASNEETIYIYLKNELGLNTAAACGVLSNINSESSFNPTASCIDTNGLTSYGICQWNGSRYNSLRNWCSNNGYAYSSLSGQLAYLKHELNNGYKKQYNYMKNEINNTASGAYDGGLYWAAQFEVCAEKYRNGRAVRARDVYWPKYGGIIDDMVTPTISTDKSSYIVGDTVNVSWVASPLSSNISHYWINVIAPDGSWLDEGNMHLSTSYSFSASQEGEYTVRIYATPRGSKDGEGSLSDEKKISVASATWYGSLTPVDFGNTFDSVILAKEPWITLRSLDSDGDYNVILQKEQGVSSEIWRFEKQSDGSYVITNFATGRVLDAYGFGTEDFTNVFTDVYNGGENQKWFIYEKNGGYVLRPAYSEMVLDVCNAAFESGTNIEIHTQNDTNAQTFALYYENQTYGSPKIGNLNAKTNVNEETDKCSVELNIDRGIYIDDQKVYRSTDKVNWSEIISGKHEENLTIIDEGVQFDTTYYYKVKYSNRYYSTESNIVSVETPTKSYNIIHTFETIPEMTDLTEEPTNESDTFSEISTDPTEETIEDTSGDTDTTDVTEEVSMSETNNTNNVKGIISIGNISVKSSDAGKTILIPVTITNNPGFNSISLKYSFDNRLKFDKIIGKKLETTFSTNESTIDVTTKSDSDFSENGIIYILQFKLPDDLSDNDIFEIAVSGINSFYDEKGNSIEDMFKFVNGKINVGGIKQDINESTESMTETLLYGDINSDNTINIADVVLLNKYIVKSASLTALQLECADCYEDGIIDASDALIILQFIVGSYERLPVIK